MSYEHRFYVVRKNPYDFDTRLHKYFAEVLYVFNLGQVCELDDVFLRYKQTDCFIYEDNTEHKVLYDCYGEPILETSICDLIIELADIARHNTNLNVEVMLSALQTIASSRIINNRELACLHYGY